MFELITISNGVAVVQHAPSGRVYRFRPLLPGFWNQLSLDRIDATDTADAAADVHARGALVFAEQVAADAYTASAEVSRSSVTMQSVLPAGRRRRLARP